MLVEASETPAEAINHQPMTDSQPTTNAANLLVFFGETT